MELEHIKKIIKDNFRQQEGLIAVLLYGSYAKGLAKDSSDLDIALLYSNEHPLPDSIALWELKEQISLALPIAVDVDLVCLNKADPIIGNQVYRHHIPLIVNDASVLAKYFARLSSEYAELKEFIKPMEQQILEKEISWLILK